LALIKYFSVNGVQSRHYKMNLINESHIIYANYLFDKQNKLVLKIKSYKKNLN